LPELVRARLAHYAWPGNIRELENVTERVAVLVAGAQLDAAALRREVQAAVPELFAGMPAVAPADTAHATGDAPRSLAGVGRATEAEHVRRVLAECGGNRAAACAQLGISATTLWRRLRDG
jgi:propionate catabolism operon transcriptional regulator